MFKSLLQLARQSKLIFAFIVGLFVLVTIITCFAESNQSSTQSLINSVYASLQKHRLTLLLYHILGFGALFLAGFYSFYSAAKIKGLSSHAIRLFGIFTGFTLLTILIVDAISLF